MHIGFKDWTKFCWCCLQSDDDLTSPSHPRLQWSKKRWIADKVSQHLTSSWQAAGSVGWAARVRRSTPPAQCALVRRLPTTRVRRARKAPLRDSFRPLPSSWRLFSYWGLLPSPPWPVSVSLATWKTFRSNCPSSNVITIPVTHTHDIHTWLRRSPSFSRVTWAQVWGWVA